MKKCKKCGGDGWTEHSPGNTRDCTCKKQTNMKKDEQVDEQLQANAEQKELWTRIVNTEKEIMKSLKGYNQFQVESMLERITFEVKDTSLVP